MSDMNFTNNVTGGNAQINQGNVTATQNVASDDLWKPAIDASETPEQAKAVETIREIVERHPADAQAIPDEDKSALQTALSFLVEHGPKVGKIAAAAGMSLPIAAPIKVLFQAAIEQYA